MWRRKNKYNALKTNGGFPSKLEAAVHNILLLKQLAGKISDIRRQQTVVLQDGDSSTRITWRVDFSYLDTDTGQRVYVEAKGLPTQEYKLKLKLWRNLKPYKLEIYMGTYKYPKLTETIFPYSDGTTKGLR